MANLTETNQWPAGIYQIETQDPVVGGPPNLPLGEGIANVQAQQLADRTKWLKDRLDAILNGADPALDTLNELAAALNDDPNFAATILAMINTASPVGIVMPFAYSTPPTGWHECDGAAISRTSYAPLFGKIGTTFGAGDGSNTFNLPDLRGEYLRGFDNGRGVDTGRALGSSQHGSHVAHDIDGLQLHQWSDVAAARLSGWEAAEITTQIFHSIANRNDVGQVGNDYYSAARVRNVALMFCIKY